MAWQVPITVDGLEYPVTFNTEGEPSQQDYDDAVQQILSQKTSPVPKSEEESPGYLSQLGSALGLGYRQMKSGVGATFNALTGDTADVAAEMAEMSKLQREQQAAQTPEDVEFMRSLEEAEKGFEKASGPLESIGALAQYPAAVLAQPGAAFKTAVQSAPNALISGATSLAGYGLGGLAGGAAGIETGPGAILTGIAGAMAGGALSNTLMEAGPAIFDVLNERTQGAASNMTADEISAYLQQNPDIVEEGMKTGAIRGSVIGAVESLGVKGSGRLLTMPERAAARAVQKELVAAGVDVASKEAVDQALLDPALRATTKAAAEAAKGQFSSAGNMARLAGASAIDTGAAGAGELAAQAVAGQEISTKEAFMEMLGDTALSLPMSVATKAVEGAQYMLNPALIADVGEVSVQNLADTGNDASAAAQDEFNKTVAEILQTPEPTVQPKQAAETPTPEVTLNEPTVPEEPELQPENIPNLEGDPFAEAKVPVSEEVIQPAPQALNAPDQITDQESLRQELQDRTGGRTPEETGVSDSLRSQEEVEEKVITPKGTPTLATEGMPTSRDVGTERDATKPEQMTPEEFKAEWDKLEEYAKKSEKIGKLDPSQPNYKPLTKKETNALSKDWREFSRMRGYSESDISEYAKWFKISGQEDRLTGARNDSWRRPIDPSVIYKQHVDRAIVENKPVSSAAVDTYGITLPEGYVKQGDLYVFQPGATGEPVQAAPPAAQVVKATAPGPSPQTTAAEKQTPAPSRKGAGAAGVTERQPVEGSIPTVPTRETPKTDLSTPESKAADQEEKDAQERQKKQRRSIRKSLDSIIDKRKTNIVQGTVTAADVEAARTELNNSGEIPNAFLTRIYESPKEFLADKSNERYFPSSYADLQANSNIEGLFENGQTLIFVKNIGVSDLDRDIADNLGISPELAAARRVIVHENGHRGVSLFTLNERREFIRHIRQMYSDEEIQNLVRLYTKYADWRTNPDSRDAALEELFMKKFDSFKKIPTGGVWDDIVQFLKKVWRRLTGSKDEPTLNDMKDVVRLLRNAMQRAEVPPNSFTLNNGGEVRLSLSDRFKGVTPAQDAEYLAAVEADDMEKAQRMVDEADSGNKIKGEYVDEDYEVIARTLLKHGKVTIYGGPRIVVKSEKLNATIDIEDDILIIDEIEASAGAGSRMLADMFAAAKESGIETVKLTASRSLGGWFWANRDFDPETLPAKEIKRRLDLLSIDQNIKDEAIELLDEGDLLGLSNLDEEILPSNYATLETKDKLLSVLENKPSPLGKVLLVGTRWDAVKEIDGAIESFPRGQIKSADPVTRDDAGNVIPLSQRFQAASPDIRYSLVEFASPETAAFNAGSEAARDTIYNERDMDVREAIRRAYQPTENSVAVPLDELFAKAKDQIPDLSEDEFSNVLQDLFEDSGAVLQEGESAFDVFTPEGRRAGFAVIMPRQAMASRISEEDAEKASKTFREDLVEAGKGRVDTAAFEGRELKGTEAPEHNVNAYELYRDGAIKLIDDLIAKTNDIIAVAESLQDPEFQIAIGLQVSKDVSSDMVTIARQLIGAELDNRLANEIKKERSASRKRQLELTKRKGISYYKAATGSGQALQNLQQIQKDPRYKWRFFFEEAENKKAEVAKERLDALTGGTNQITNTINESENEASIEAVKALEAEDAGAIEDDQDAIDLAEGEATLDTRGKNLWEKFKDLIRKRGIAMRALDALRAGNRAKASISSEERNAISQMSEEELIKLIADIDNEMASVFDEFTKTPATRKKREKMVATAKKRAEQGKPIEAPSLSKKELIEQMLVGFNDRDSIINEVGDALLKAAEQRKAKPKQKTAIQDLIAAIRQTLTANLKGDQIKADQPSLGKLLGKTFAQQGSEAALFAKSWEDGRKKVRAMLSEMGVDDASLEEELDAIMPPTPTLAYAPAAAKRAITMAIKEAGLSARDAISNPAFFRETIMEKFNEAAAKENLTEEGWNQSGKALAEKAINEFIDSARIKAEERLAESKDKMEKRKVEIADKRASQLIYSVEELFRQNSQDLQTSKSGDSINKAFRDQVKEPVSIGKFKERLAKLSVSDQVAERLFKTAAREKADLQAMKAFEFLEGPNARQNLLREMNKARPAYQVPLERAMPWKDILSQKSQNVEEYRQRIFDAISSLPAMENITEDQKQRLAELYAEAFEEKREEILKRILEREEARLFNSNAITKKAAKALQESRNKIIELVNLGGFNNDDLVKILGESFGISTSFTEEQKAKITDLAEKLQDEDMNQAKRNKLAMQFVVELAGATDSSVAEIMSNVWTSSVLFGPQTIFSIGAAFLNGGYNIITVGMNRAMSKLFKGDFVGAIDESIVILKGIARYLGAFKQSGRRAWNYLWSGEVEQLGASANDILGEIKSFDDLQKFKRHKLLAENLAKDPRALRRYVGQYLRFVNRLLTALDSFNVMVTKAGTTSLALRMSGLDPNKIVEAEKMLNLKSYKQDIIDKEFGGVAPTNSLEKGRLDSYAEAAMYKALDKFGGKMENADYFASDSAMTMNPTGLGGYFYRKITGIDKEARKSADEYLEKVKKNWMSQKDLDSFRDLSLAYIRQFFVYQAANLAGYKFIRYASNKFNQGISYLPLIGLARKFEARGDEIKGKDAFIETIHRNQIIGALMTVIAASVIKALEDEPDDEKRGWLWNGGWENLTPDQKKQRLALGQKEYTFGFKYNGRWYYFNYLNWPINQPLSAIGSMSDQIRFSPQQWGEKGALSKITSGMVSGLKSTLDMPALSQLGEIFGSRISSKDPTERTIDRTSRVLSGWVGGFVPRVLKDIDFYTQPELRKYEGLWEKTASHIPIYRRYVGDEYYDILGHSIKRNVIPGSREFMAGPTEPEYKILGALNARNIWLTPANAEYRMIGKGRNRRRLTQEEADAYSLESGKAYRQMLLRYGQRALQMPTERARAFLLDKADEARDRALKKAVR